MKSILQNEKAFFITSVMSLPFNVVIILAVVLGVGGIVGGIIKSIIDMFK